MKRAQSASENSTMMFVDNPRKASGLWERATKAQDVYRKKQAVLIAKNKYKTAAHAVKAFAKFSQANAEFTKFMAQFGKLESAADLEKITRNKEARRKFGELSKARHDAQEQANIARLAFPKLKLKIKKQ